MRKLIQMATVLACSALASWAGPSISLNGNTVFTVNYNGYDDNDGYAFPDISSSVKYTITDWTTGTDNSSTIPFSSGTKYTSFKMAMEISNTSTVTSYVTSLGWVTNPDIEGNNTASGDFWTYFNDGSSIDSRFPSVDACMSDLSNDCNGDNAGDGVANGKKTTVTATVYFAGQSGVNFQNFYVRYDGMDYDLKVGSKWKNFENGIGTGDVPSNTTVTPEPSSMAALAAGIGAVAFAVRKRKQQA